MLYYNKGQQIYLCGDSGDMGIEDYWVRVSSPAIIEEDLTDDNDTVLVTIEQIDNDNNVCVAISGDWLRKDYKLHSGYERQLTDKEINIAMQDYLDVLNDKKIQDILLNQTEDVNNTYEQLYNYLRHTTLINDFIGDSRNLECVKDYGYLGIDTGEYDKDGIAIEVEFSDILDNKITISPVINIKAKGDYFTHEEIDVTHHINLTDEQKKLVTPY
jgi:hypothetical protein